MLEGFSSLGESIHTFKGRTTLRVMTFAFTKLTLQSSFEMSQVSIEHCLCFCKVLCTLLYFFLFFFISKVYLNGLRLGLRLGLVVDLLVFIDVHTVTVVLT